MVQSSAEALILDRPIAYGRAIVIEAARGRARRALIDARLAAARAAGAETHLLSCRIDTGGPWAGLADLLRALLPQIEAAHPEALARHRYELALAVPELRQRFPSGTRA